MKENEEIEVEMVETDGKVNVKYDQTIINFGSLGRELKISPKAHICVNKAGYKQQMFVDCVTITVGIGRDHVADVIMRKESWEAFKAGAEVTITTTKEFKEKFL